MLDLICNHQYVWGTIAADRSRWHSDGFSYDVMPIAGGGLSFPTPQSRVVIPRRTGDPWGSIGAIKVEIVASRQAAGGTVIDADGCFRVSFTGSQAIVVQILNYTLTFQIGDVALANSIALNFSHDGVNQLNAYFNVILKTGEQGGSSSPITLPGQVPPVGPKGIWIGSQIGSPNNHFNGSISSVKIWRADPEAIGNTFVGRPFPPSTLKCWGDLSGEMRTALAANPDCAAWLINFIEQQQKQVVQRLGQKSPDTTAQFYQMCASYQKLWSGGKVGSPEMQALMVQMTKWLKIEGIFSADDESVQVLQNPCMARIIGAIKPLDCDPDAQLLIKAIIAAQS